MRALKFLRESYLSGEPFRSFSNIKWPVIEYIDKDLLNDSDIKKVLGN